MRKAGASLVKTIVYLLIAGIVLTSPVLIKLAVIPALMLLIPFGATIRNVRVEWDEKVSVGEPFSVSMLLSVTGFGIVRLRHKLPDHFELLEGSNFKETFVFGKKFVKIHYKAKATKRGVYRLDSVEYEIEPVTQAFVKRGICKVDVNVEVKHKVPRIRKVKEIRGRAKSPVPGIDIAKIGVPGTDFREIRDYMPGDSIKFINWKATARKGKLMVNQYEVEGKKAVWIFLDANPYMMHGTNVKNYLESAIEVSNALAYYYSTRGHKVGLYVIGDKRIMHPEVGSRQFKRISKALLEVEGGKESVQEAIENCKKMLLIYRPLVVLVTRAERVKAEPLLKLSKLMPVQIFALKGLDQGFSGYVMEAARRRAVSRFRVCGSCIEVDVNKPFTAF